MWPFSKQRSFPGVKQNADGTIEFSLTEEEARQADLALQSFGGVLVHPEVAERVRNGTIAVALSRYAKDLVAVHCVGVTEPEYKANWPAIRGAIEKAVAAEWKASSLCSLPIFLYHRASFLQMLGMKDEARQLFASFLKRHSEFEMDQVDTSLLNYEGTDIEHALSHAKREA
jgi:hypothetical protein